MPRPIPDELRIRVVTAWMNGDGSFRKLAARFAVGEATVNRWTVRLRKTGSVSPDPMGGARRGFRVDASGEEVICDLLDTNPDLTLPEVCDALEMANGTVVSPQTMSTTVRRLGYSKKRGSTARKRRIDRTL